MYIKLKKKIFYLLVLYTCTPVYMYTLSIPVEKGDSIFSTVDVLILRNDYPCTFTLYIVNYVVNSLCIEPSFERFISLDFLM